MKAKIVWPRTILDILFDLPEQEREVFLDKVERLSAFPEMHPVRVTGRFRWLRWLFSGNWLVYHRYVEQTVCIRGLWRARIP